MIKMSFFNGTLKRDELKKFIHGTDKPIVYTYGFASKHPTTYKVPVSKEEACRIIDKESFLDAREERGYLHLNAFSVNDMW